VDQDTFRSRLLSAGQQAVQLARECVIQALPDEMAFLVYPNQSYDRNPRMGDEVVFPGDSLNGKCHGPWSADEVVAFLWRNGKVPEWIDVYVQAEDSIRSLIRLVCCGRFTGQAELLYHRDKGFPPFQAMGPPVPWRYFMGDKEGKFDLYWQEQQPRVTDDVKCAEPEFSSFVVSGF
jgi:hypothetical protein